MSESRIKKFAKKMSIFMAFIMTVSLLSGTSALAAAKTSINKKTVVLKVGQTVKLKLNKNKKKVKWTSKNNKIATVSKKGKVKAKKQGKTYIVAKVGKKKYSCKVIVRSKKNVEPTVPKTTKAEEITKVPETSNTGEVTTTETSRQEEATTTPETTKQEEVTTIPETTGGDESTSVTPADSFGYAPSADHTTITINRYNGKSANVVIPDTINGMKVVKIATQTFQESDENAVRIKSVVIPEGVKEIERLAFANCKYLEKLTIKGNSLVTIGNQAFDRCSSLKTVHLPESVKIIGEYAFAGCTSMSSVNVPKSYQGSTGVGAIFSGCAGLEEIVIDDGATAIPSFSYCEALKEIEIPKSVTSLAEDQFSGCSALEKVVINSSIDTITTDMLSDCSSLKEIVLPEKLTTIEEYAFYGCDSLESISIPASVIKIEENAFASCDALKTIIGAKGSYAEKFASENGYVFLEK